MNATKRIKLSEFSLSIESHWGLFQSRTYINYSHKLHCHYMVYDVELTEVKVRLFFCSLSKYIDWISLLTTNYRLDFNDANHINFRRCVFEVFFKDAKRLLGLVKSQSRNFATQIANISVTVFQYNILNTAKRFKAFQTIGGLFSESTGGVIQLYVNEKIGGILQEIVRIIAEAFETYDEKSDYHFD